MYQKNLIMMSRDLAASFFFIAVKSTTRVCIVNVNISPYSIYSATMHSQSTAFQSMGLIYFTILGDKLLLPFKLKNLTV